MIYFALSLRLCATAIGCHWLEVEEFSSEAQCLEIGKLWTADGGDADIVDWKCIVKMRERKIKDDPFRNRG